jgi:SAM-dependent methyltransferase
MATTEIESEGVGAAPIAGPDHRDIHVTMSGSRTVLSWHGHRGVRLDASKGFQVIACGPCDFKHVVPLPGDADLERLYREDFYSTEKPRYLERYQEDLPWWSIVYEDRYAELEALLPPDRRRLLEIGSGPGFFLLHGQQQGWTVLGVEPAAQAAAHSRALGLQIVEELLTPALAPTLGTFDAVVLAEVLEHIPDPRAMLEVVHSLVRPGGIACVVVPNDYNPFQEALRSACGYEPWWVAPPHHVNYFEPRSLERLLARCGFDVIRRESTFPIDLFLLMGDDYVGNDALGRLCHAKRKRFELTLARAGGADLKRRLYAALAELGLGREIVLYARAR